jgi:hypothetical protein
MKMQSCAISSLLMLTIAMASGCESKPKAIYGTLGLVSVSGRVTLDGQPLAKAVITFDDVQDGTFSFGQTDSSGNYKLRLDSDMMGVKPGRKIVRISTTRKILGLNSSEEGGESNSEGGVAKPEMEKELVPDKYYKKSELTAEVSASNKTFNFELKSSSTFGIGS